MALALDIQSNIICQQYLNTYNIHLYVSEL